MFFIKKYKYFLETKLTFHFISIYLYNYASQKLLSKVKKYLIFPTPASYIQLQNIKLLLPEWYHDHREKRCETVVSPNAWKYPYPTQIFYWLCPAMDYEKLALQITINFFMFRLLYHVTNINSTKSCRGATRVLNEIGE